MSQHLFTSFHKKVLSAVLIAALLVVFGMLFFRPTPKVLAANGPTMSLSVDGVNGNFDVKDFNWQLDAKNNAKGGGGGGNQLAFSDLAMTLKTNPASVRLFQMASTGEHVKTLKLTVNQVNGSTIVIKLQDVLVTSYGTTGSDQDDTLLDQVAFDYSQIIITNGNATAGWDLKKNAKI